MDLEQDEVFGASSRDGDLSGASFRFRHAEDHAAANPRVGSIHRGRILTTLVSTVLTFHLRNCAVCEGIRRVRATGGPRPRWNVNAPAYRYDVLFSTFWQGSCQPNVQKQSREDIQTF